jgi:TolB-like protein/DNA-binding SARP family transcriptional activator
MRDEVCVTRAREVAILGATESPASTSNNATEAPTRWSLRLFGGFELRALPGGDKVALPAKRERVLLAYLAVSPNFRQTRRKLAALLWGDAADETALDNLRTCIWSLRKALSDGTHRVIGSEGDDIVLDAAAFDADVVAFRDLAAQSGRVELEEAAKLYSGDFLEGLDIENEEFESWRREEASRYRDQALDVLVRLLTQLSECGETDRAIEAGLRILRLEPLHEPAVRRLMRLYGESGRRGPAIQLFRTLADALRQELDAQPEAETRAVFADVSHGSEERTGIPAAEAVADVKPSPHPASLASPSDKPHEPSRPRAQHLAPADSATWQGLQHAKARKLNWILAGTLAAAMALFLIYQLGPPAGTTTAPQTVEAAKAASSPQPGGISIAVLPFGNLSDDTGQEFFSDGMTEEITAALAKVPDLQVVARASAFQFKDERKDMRAVGQALGARYLIDGSVRRAGNRVRITAQLIRTDNGVNVWSESYDRELTDVFAIQESIAEAIAGSLSVPLGLKPGETLISSRIADPEVYEQYLRERAQRRDSSRGFPATPDTLEAVVARAPAFAPGWARLAGAYRGAAANAGRSGDSKASSLLTDKMEAAARKAIELDASYVGGYSELAAAHTRRGKWAEAEDLYKQALALDSNDSTLLHVYSQTLVAAGRLKEGLRLRERLRTLEPLVPNYDQITARIMLSNGQTDASIAILEPDLSTGALRNVYLAEAYAVQGRFTDAADTLLRITNAIDRRSVEDAARLLRSAPTKTDVPEKLPALVAELGFVYAYIGAPERVLEYPEKAAKEGLLITVSAVWRPAAAPLRKTERFKALVRNAGLVDYWRARGWPDLCRPVGADDFVCD